MSTGPALVPLGPGDRDRVRRWLQLPEVRAFWGSAAAAAAEVSLALDSPGALCRMIRWDGVPVGYAHALDCVQIGGDHAAALAPGTWDCALFVAEPAHRGRGLGADALRLLVAEVFETTMALACVIRVPVRSEMAARAVEAAGFRWVRVAGDAALGPVWVMRAERPAR
jgi:RimJ/RimL family protein N-acetyltransferase